MRRRITAICLALAALGMLAAVPAAPAATAKAKRPTITKVAPMRTRVGSKIKIRGRHFSSRRRRNTVIFRSPDGRTAFAKPRRATRRKLVVVVPRAIARIVKGKRTVRFKLRVVRGKRYGRWTKRRISPVVLGSLAGGGSICASDFDDGDRLSNTLEAKIDTDRCEADTDGDGIEDGFEYKSAVDLNNDEYQEPNESLPYPGKRPYPNPLDPTDAGFDYDGDTLGLALEQKLWKYSTTPESRTLFPLNYSDGMKHSIYAHRAGHGDRRFPALAAAGYSKATAFVNWAASNGYRTVYIDVHHPASRPVGFYGLFDINLNHSESISELRYLDDGSGFLDDGERDEDADGLSNRSENTHNMQSGWWESCYAAERPYYLKYADTDPFDADTDGDGVRDGADDQDHDDLPNLMELSRYRASGINDTEGYEEGFFDECDLDKDLAEDLSAQDPPIKHHATAYGQLNPYNPCLPDTASRTCKTYADFGSPWAPFDKSPDWYSLN